MVKLETSLGTQSARPTGLQQRRGLARHDDVHHRGAGGRPGGTWRWFQNRVNFHYNRLIPGPTRSLG